MCHLNYNLNILCDMILVTNKVTSTSAALFYECLDKICHKFYTVAGNLQTGKQ